MAFLVSSTSRSHSPEEQNDRIRMGILGLRFGGALLRNFLMPGKAGNRYVEVVSLCDQDPNVAQAAHQASGIKLADDLDAMLADPDIEAIGLITSPAGRSGLLQRILAAGKHVLTTKPFELDSAAAAEALEQARTQRLVVMANSPAPSVGPALGCALAWQDEFQLGKPLSARLWAGKSRHHEEADGSWMDDPLRCPIPPVLRIGVYMINDLVRVFGEPLEVQSMECRQRTGRPTADAAQLNIRFSDNGLANLQVTFALADGQNHSAWAIAFEKGTVYCNHHPAYAGNCPPPTSAGAFPMHLLRHGPDGKIDHQMDSVDDIHSAYPWEMFHSFIRTGRLPPTDYYDVILRGVRLLEAAARSARSSRTEPVASQHQWKPLAC